MSQEQVAKFVRALAEDPELRSRADEGGQSASSWVALGKATGHNFNEADVVGFAETVTGESANANTAIGLITKIGSESAGRDTTALRFSPQLFTRIGAVVRRHGDGRQSVYQDFGSELGELAQDRSGRADPPRGLVLSSGLTLASRR